MITLEQANKEDAGTCYAILDSARAFQREQGFVQWTDDYPSLQSVLADIETGKGYVLRVDGTIAGYMYLDTDGEPAYAQIDGAWHADAPYLAAHRIGFSPDFRGIGLSDTMFRLLEDLCRKLQIRWIRIDTGFPNQRMQHVLEKNGFRYCGVIRYEGDGRMAYDREVS